MILEENISIEFVLPLLEGVQKLMGQNCEILVHDFRKGFDQSIVHAINAELSGRAVGGKPRGAMITRFGKDISTLEASEVLFYKGKGGQVFKSCSTLLADQSGKVVGSICINIEISQLLGMNALMIDFLDTTPKEALHEDGTAIVAQNVDDVLQYYINTCEKTIGTTMELMSKEEKVRALTFFDEKGVFKISKASVLLCERFQISKYTLYNYLDESRKTS